MLMESRDVKHPLFVRLLVPLQCPSVSMTGARGGRVAGGTASAVPYIRVGMSQVVSRSVPGPAKLCFCHAQQGQPIFHQLVCVRQLKAFVASS